jgi:hypothetical protein
MLTTVEKAITERIVKTALNAGYLVGVNVDGETELNPCKNLSEILKVSFNFDYIDLVLEDCTDKENTYSSISLNLFNDGLDIISDYTINLEAFFQALNFKQLVIDL